MHEKNIINDNKIKFDEAFKDLLKKFPIALNKKETKANIIKNIKKGFISNTFKDQTETI